MKRICSRKRRKKVIDIIIDSSLYFCACNTFDFIYYFFKKSLSFYILLWIIFANHVERNYRRELMNHFLLCLRELSIDLYQLGNYMSNLCPELKYANMFFAIIVVAHIECNPNPAHFRWHKYVYADRNMSSSTLQWIINDFFRSKGIFI